MERRAPERCGDGGAEGEGGKAMYLAAPEDDIMSLTRTSTLGDRERERENREVM